MVLTMDLKEAKFTLADVIKLISYAVTITVFAITIHLGLGSLKETVSEIRETQIENTKKNEIRWQVTEARLNQLESTQRLFEQRLQQMEDKK